jgi:hypothetical protein
MTQGEFDAMLCWLVEDWAERRVAGLDLVRAVRWDELGLDLTRSVGCVCRWGRAHGLVTVTAAVAAKMKAALARVRASYPPQVKRVAAVVQREERVGCHQNHHLKNV